MCLSWFSRRAGDLATSVLEIDPSNSSDEKDNRPTKLYPHPAPLRHSGEKKTGERFYLTRFVTINPVSGAWILPEAKI